MSKIQSVIGLLRLGTIDSYLPDEAKVTVNLDLSGSFQVTAQVPMSLFGLGGIFVGSYPVKGTAVIVGQAEGNMWYVVAYLTRDGGAMPELLPGSVLMQVNDTTKIVLDKKSGIKLGNDDHALLVDSIRDVLVSNFYSTLSFTEASRSIDGIVRRELKPNDNFSSEARLIGPEFNDHLTAIGLDPTIAIDSTNSGDSIRNLPFVEKREVLYEFAYSYLPKTDSEEFTYYEDKLPAHKVSDTINRKHSRTDLLSLSQHSPNYLFESVKGTVIDIYGNILDLNRDILQVGKDKKTSLKDNESKADAYKNIRELERRSLAAHFELNAKKANSNPDPDSTDDYARDRSRAFFDIDKEGQFKINVPASSETGNVAVLARYENYSVLKGVQDGTDPDLYYLNNDNRDVYHDSFTSFKSQVTVKTEDDTVALPSNRNATDSVCSVGTMYHAVTDTLSAYRTAKYISFELDRVTHIVDLPVVDKVVEDTIYNSGDKANAGGRSGNINIEGFLELNIGANTVDRQSLWLDTAGGILASIGRDKRNISLGMSLDGDLLLQIGGSTVADDSRFLKEFNAYRAGAMEVRVLGTGVEASVFRIDDFGVTFTTPSRISLSSNKSMNLKSMGQLHISGEEVFINDRLVDKFGANI